MANKKARIAAGVAIGAIAFLGIGVAAAAASGAKPTAGGEGDDGDGDGGLTDAGYHGPGPNMPGGEQGGNGGAPPSGPSMQRPDSIAPGDLWIAPDCSDVMIGADWLAQTARPAIEAWSQDGVPASEPEGGLTFDVDASPERVVREILGPYGPLCVDTWPWRDIELARNPPPETTDFPDTPDGYNEYLAAFEEWDSALADRQQDALAANRAYGELVVMVYNAVMDVAGKGYNA